MRDCMGLTTGAVWLRRFVASALMMTIGLAAGTSFAQAGKPSPTADKGADKRGKAVANGGYPTADRVEFVLECMRNNGGDYGHLYKCSCAIDEIAKRLDYEQYVDGSSTARYQGMGGERAGVFRDAPSARDMAKQYREVVGAARKTCNVGH